MGSSENRLASSLRTGARVVGASCTIPSSFSAEIVATSGADYIVIDLQHGLASFTDLVHMLQAIGNHSPTPLVRIPHRDLATAQRALDAGAMGIVVPMVETRDEALAAATSCRYAPEGTRSYGPVRARMHIGADPAVANDNVLCFVQVETLEGLEKVAEIASCPGIDGIYVGPADLGLVLNSAPRGSRGSLDSALERIVQACGEAEITPAIHTGNAPAAAEAFGQGFKMVTVGTDAVALRNGYSSDLAAARGHADPPAESHSPY